MTRIEIIIPTLRRPEHLRRCLEALILQDTPATAVLVGIRADDGLSREVVTAFQKRLPVVEVEAKGVGVVGSMNSCLAATTGDYVGLLDDDVEIPPNWISVMKDHLERRANVLAAGGRDLLMDHPELRRTEPLVEDVGCLHWYGRVTGDHHRAGGSAREVDILRGSNCLYLGAFLRKAGFETELRGSGAQVNWELALALQAKAEGCRMFFDPTVKVIHNVAPRHDEDLTHRGGFSITGTSDIAYNETLVAVKHGRGWTRTALLLWEVLVGSFTCPGLARAAYMFVFKPRDRTFHRCMATWNGRLAVMKRFSSKAPSQ